MDSQKVAIINTYFAVAQKFEKAYCYPSQVHTLRLLAKYHRIKISLRTLNRRLRELEDDGFLRRTRRHREGKGRKILFNTTLTHLMARSFDWVAKGLERASRFFSFYRLPKMALYRFKTARYPSDGDNLACVVARFLLKGSAPRTTNGP